MRMGQGLAFSGFISHFQNRLFEWMAAFMMIGISVVLMSSPNSIAFGTFKYIVDIGVSQGAIAVILLVFGLLRFVALYVNGYWQPIGPRLRAGCALVAAIFWSQMLAALLLHSSDTQALSMAVPIYLFLTTGEIISCYRAAIDVRQHQP